MPDRGLRRHRMVVSGRLPLAIGIGAAMGVMTLFVGFVLISKLGLRTAMAPWDIAALRFGVAGAVMLPVVLRNGFLGLGLPRVLMLAGAGGLGFALCAYWGFALAPGNHGSALIHGTLPLTTAVVAGTLNRTWPTRWQLWSSMAVILGATAMVWPGLVMPHGRQPLGDVLLLGASICWSCFGLMCSRWRPPPFATAAVVAVVSALVYLPAYLASGLSLLSEAPLEDIVRQAAFQGLAIGVGSTLMYSIAVATIGPASTALAAALVPALTATGAVLFLGEQMEAIEVTGLALITFGVVLGTLGATRGGGALDSGQGRTPQRQRVHTRSAAATQARRTRRIPGHDPRARDQS